MNLTVKSTVCGHLYVESHCGGKQHFDSLADVAQYAKNNGYDSVTLPTDALANLPEAVTA